MALMPKSVQRWSPRSITTSSRSAVAVKSRAFCPGRWTLTEGGNHSPRPRSFTCCRSHHTTSCVVVLPGVMTSLEKARVIERVDDLHACAGRWAASPARAPRCTRGAGSPRARSGRSRDRARSRASRARPRKARRRTRGCGRRSPRCWRACAPPPACAAAPTAPRPRARGPPPPGRDTPCRARRCCPHPGSGARRPSPGPWSKKTRMVRRRAAMTDGETSEKKTGSSLYSRHTTSHIETPWRRISVGQHPLQAGLQPLLPDLLLLAQGRQLRWHRGPRRGRQTGGSGKHRHQQDQGGGAARHGSLLGDGRGGGIRPLRSSRARASGRADG